MYKRIIESQKHRTLIKTKLLVWTFETKKMKEQRLENDTVV